MWGPWPAAPPPPGTTLLKAAQESGVGLVSLCGGEGWCESCLVIVTTGNVNYPTQSELDYLSAEDLEAGYRLACQVAPQTDVRIDIPAEAFRAVGRTVLRDSSASSVSSPMSRFPMLARVLLLCKHARPCEQQSSVATRKRACALFQLTCGRLSAVRMDHSR